MVLVEILKASHFNLIDQNFAILEFGHEKEEEVLDFEDLGIIEVDDEEWNEYDVVEADNSRRKIPNLKQKVNNISPQL